MVVVLLIIYLYELPDWCRSAREIPCKLRYPQCNSTPSPPAQPRLSPADWGVLLSAPHGEPHADLRARDGSECAESLWLQPSLCFVHQWQRKRLIRRMWTAPRCVFWMQSQLRRLTARRSKCRVSFGDKACLDAMEPRTAGWAARTGSVLTCRWVGFADLDGPSYSDATTRPCDDVGGCCCPQCPG